MGRNENGRNYLIFAEFVEVLKVKRIIENLIHIGFQNLGFAYFEFEAKYNSIKKQYNVNPLAKTGNIIFKNDLTVFYRKRRQNALHNRYFSFPRFLCCCESNAMCAAIYYTNAGRNVFPVLLRFFGAFLSGKIVFPCSRVLLCPNSPCLSMVLVCGQNFCCGQYVVVMWSAMPSEFCSQCESGGNCIVALAAAVVKRFRR